MQEATMIYICRWPDIPMQNTSVTEIEIPQIALGDSATRLYIFAICRTNISQQKKKERS